MLVFEQVSKTFMLGAHCVVALKSIDLEVKAGELLAIVGPSGSGKTTMMNIIGLLDRPTAGRYLLDGAEVTHLSAQQRARLRNVKIGFIFQSFMLLPRLTAWQNVSLPLLYRGVDRRTIQQQAMAMLEQVGLLQHAHHRPMELSGGQQQRVAIARALVTKPRIILADEPTGALDTQTGAEILALLQAINQETQATVIMITHDPQIAAQCKRVIAICDGEIG